jgi:TfoX/Sxy family transcriptional regulator of competence genes
MAYDEGLAERIREMLAARTDVREKLMFGGIAFLINGNMAVGVAKEDLMIRVPPEAHEALLVQPHARPMDFTGRPMKGWLFVDPQGVESDADLRRWIERGAAYASSLPAKL